MTATDRPHRPDLPSQSSDDEEDAVLSTLSPADLRLALEAGHFTCSDVRVASLPPPADARASFITLHKARVAAILALFESSNLCFDSESTVDWAGVDCFQVMHPGGALSAMPLVVEKVSETPAVDGQPAKKTFSYKLATLADIDKPELRAAAFYVKGQVSGASWYEVDVRAPRACDRRKWAAFLRGPAESSGTKGGTRTAASGTQPGTKAASGTTGGTPAPTAPHKCTWTHGDRCSRGTCPIGECSICFIRAPDGSKLPGKSAVSGCRCAASKAKDKASADATTVAVVRLPPPAAQAEAAAAATQAARARLAEQLAAQQRRTSAPGTDTAQATTAAVGADASASAAAPASKPKAAARRRGAARRIRGSATAVPPTAGTAAGASAVADRATPPPSGDPCSAPAAPASPSATAVPTASPSATAVPTAGAAAGTDAVADRATSPTGSGAGCSAPAPASTSASVASASPPSATSVTSTGGAGAAAAVADAADEFLDEVQSAVATTRRASRPRRPRRTTGGSAHRRLPPFSPWMTFTGPLLPPPSTSAVAPRRPMLLPPWWVSAEDAPWQTFDVYGVPLFRGCAPGFHLFLRQPHAFYRPDGCGYCRCVRCGVDDLLMGQHVRHMHLAFQKRVCLLEQRRKAEAAASSRNRRRPRATETPGSAAPRRKRGRRPSAAGGATTVPLQISSDGDGDGANEGPKGGGAPDGGVSTGGAGGDGGGDGGGAGALGGGGSSTADDDPGNLAADAGGADGGDADAAHADAGLPRVDGGRTRLPEDRPPTRHVAGSDDTPLPQDWCHPGPVTFYIPLSLVRRLMAKLNLSRSHSRLEASDRSRPRSTQLSWGRPVVDRERDVLDATFRLIIAAAWPELKDDKALNFEIMIILHTAPGESASYVDTRRSIWCQWRVGTIRIPLPIPKATAKPFVRFATVHSRGVHRVHDPPYDIVSPCAWINCFGGAPAAGDDPAAAHTDGCSDGTANDDGVYAAQLAIFVWRATEHGKVKGVPSLQIPGTCPIRNVVWSNPRTNNAAMAALFGDRMPPAPSTSSYHDALDYLYANANLFSPDRVWIQFDVQTGSAARPFKGILLRTRKAGAITGYWSTSLLPVAKAGDVIVSLKFGDDGRLSEMTVVTRKSDGGDGGSKGGRGRAPVAGLASGGGKAAGGAGDSAKAGSGQGDGTDKRTGGLLDDDGGAASVGDGFGGMLGLGDGLAGGGGMPFAGPGAAGGFDAAVAAARQAESVAASDAVAAARADAAAARQAEVSASAAAAAARADAAAARAEASTSAAVAAARADAAAEVAASAGLAADTALAAMKTRYEDMREQYQSTVRLAERTQSALDAERTARSKAEAAAAAAQARAAALTGQVRLMIPLLIHEIQSRERVIEQARAERADAAAEREGQAVRSAQVSTGQMQILLQALSRQRIDTPTVPALATSASLHAAPAEPSPAPPRKAPAATASGSGLPGASLSPLSPLSALAGSTPVRQTDAPGSGSSVDSDSRSVASDATMPAGAGGTRGNITDVLAGFMDALRLPDDADI